MKDSTETLYNTDYIGEINHCVCEKLPEYDSVRDGLFLHYAYESENDLIMQWFYWCIMIV